MHDLIQPELERFAYAPNGTFGRLLLPGGVSCYTVERPWLGNQQSKSCIPEGVYTLRQRPSNVVRRSTRGRYFKGWEVCDVPDRTFIMLHPGNTMTDLEGCIAPGLGLGWLSSMWAVTDSQDAFDEVMHALSHRDEWVLRIYPKRIEYP